MGLLKKLEKILSSIGEVGRNVSNISRQHQTWAREMSELSDDWNSVANWISRKKSNLSGHDWEMFKSFLRANRAGAQKDNDPGEFNTWNMMLSFAEDLDLNICD